VEKARQAERELSPEEDEQERAAGAELSTRIPTVHRTILPAGLTALCFENDDTRIVLLFVRLRSLLFALCPDHPVALCETCRRTYTPEQLGTEIGDGCYLCRHCGADLRESVLAHSRTCPNLILKKPLARIASGTSSTIPPAVSERFEARRRARLGLGVHTTAR